MATRTAALVVFINRFMVFPLSSFGERLDQLTQKAAESFKITKQERRLLGSAGFYCYAYLV